MCVCVLLLVAQLWLFVTPWMGTHQALLSMGVFRQEYWSGLPFWTWLLGKCAGLSRIKTGSDMFIFAFCKHHWDNIKETKWKSYIGKLFPSLTVLKSIPDSILWLALITSLIKGWLVITSHHILSSWTTILFKSAHGPGQSSQIKETVFWPFIYLVCMCLFLTGVYCRSI